MMTMCATVIKTHCSDLLVLDQCTDQEVIVHSQHSCCFCPCDRVCIEYSGAMTMSIPPQITACCIRKLPSCC